MWNFRYIMSFPPIKGGSYSSNGVILPVGHFNSCCQDQQLKHQDLRRATCCNTTFIWFWNWCKTWLSRFSLILGLNHYDLYGGIYVAQVLIIAIQSRTDGSSVVNSYMILLLYICSANLRMISKASISGVYVRNFQYIEERDTGRKNAKISLVPNLRTYIHTYIH